MNEARTFEAIVTKAREYQADDLFGFRMADLVQCLPLDYAKEFLRADADTSGWTPVSADPASVVQRMRDYLPFAWDKANGRRGLSAARSLNHFEAWLWLCGVDVSLDDYTHYGKPQLRAISEALGFDWRDHDDGDWRNSEYDGGVDPLPAADIDLPDLKEAARG